MKKIFPVLKNKYLLATIGFVVWVGFFDRNDFFSQWERREKLKMHIKDMEYFQAEIEKDRADLLRLTSNDGNLERFAREKYLMKKDHEDIFVFVKQKP